MKWMTEQEIPEEIWKYQGKNVHVAKCKGCSNNYYTILKEKEGKCPICELTQSMRDLWHDSMERTLQDLAERSKLQK